MPGNRRETRFPSRLSIAVTAETRAALDAIADDAELSVGHVARDCIARGAPLVRDAVRKRKRQEARQQARQAERQDAGKPAPEDPF